MINSYSWQRILAVKILDERNYQRKTKKDLNNSFFSFADLRTAFDLLDRDQDGMVTPTELQFMLRNLGIEMSDELIDGLMKEASKTGKLSY